MADYSVNVVIRIRVVGATLDLPPSPAVPHISRSAGVITAMLCRAAGS